MCSSGHALIRTWFDGAWWLACVNPGCTYRIFESHPTHQQEAPVSETVKIEFDPELHNGSHPQDDVEKMVWPVLDTAYNLLRDLAVKVTLAEIRDQSPELESDSDLFLQSITSGVPGAPTCYRDLAPISSIARTGFLGVFEALVRQSMKDAIEGLGVIVDG